MVRENVLVRTVYPIAGGIVFLGDQIEKGDDECVRVLILVIGLLSMLKSSLFLEWF